MVEYSLQLDRVFSSLSDPTRRDIFQRVTGKEQTVNDIASNYKISLAAVSKHLKVLEQARLVHKRRNGRQQLVIATPVTLKGVQEYLDKYQQLWDTRFDALDKYLKKEGEHT